MSSPDETGLLLIAPVALPLLAAVLGALWLGIRLRGFSALVVVASASTLVGVVALAQALPVDGRLVASLPGLLGSIEFAADRFSLIFALVAALVWFCASVYATAYLRGDPRGPQLQLTSLVLLSLTQGVFLAGDLLTLFVFFEALGLVGLLLVLHEGSDRARRAALKYLWMTLLGGVALLAGILIWAGVAGSAAIGSLPSTADPELARLAFVLMLIGFGVKAGMVPLHVWLPDAHSVAPTPASALLSGVMIKAGAYGVFRCLEMLAQPDPSIATAAALGPLARQAGGLVAGIGVVSMLVGVVFALGQRHAKRMLAWHSVSQMGFILTGLGTGAWLGGDGGLGTAGGLVHVVNHALFKSCLFLGVGAVMIGAGTGDMYRLGGLWRRMPTTLALMLIAAAGIAGVPLFNGFVSKCMIHHALVHAAAQPGGAGFAIAELLYYLACIGTAASFIKLIWLVFFAAPAENRSGQQASLSSAREAPRPMQAAMLVLACFILLLGLRPGLLVTYMMSSSGAASGPWLHYLEQDFLSLADLRSAGLMLAGGLVLFRAGMRFGWFHLVLPPVVGVDFWYRAAGRGLQTLCRWSGRRAAGIRSLVTRKVLTAVETALSMLRRGFADRPRLQAFGATWRRPHDALYLEFDELRERILDEAEDRVRTLDHYPISTHERLQDSARHHAGWLATRLMARLHDLEPGAALARARGSEFRRELARIALQLAEAELDAGEEASARSIAAMSAAQGLIDSLSEARPDAAAAQLHERSAWSELCSILLHLAIDPRYRHWPASENLALGEFASRLRRAMSRFAHDPGVGLAVVGLVMILLFFAMLWRSA